MDKTCRILSVICGKNHCLSQSIDIISSNAFSHGVHCLTACGTVFQAVQSQQQADRDFALARLEQSRIMLAIRLKEHHGKNHEVIDEASDFVRNVYQDVWPSLSATKPEKCADSSSNTAKDPNFFARMVSSSLAITGSSFNLKSLGGALGNSAALALGIVTVLQLRWLASGAHSPGVGNYSYRRISEKNSSSRLGTSPSGSRMARLDVSLARD
jgi:hypothetical protein